MFTKAHLDFIARAISDHCADNKMSGLNSETLLRAFQYKFPDTVSGMSTFRNWINQAKDAGIFPAEGRKGRNGGWFPLELNVKPKWAPPPPTEILQAAENKETFLAIREPSRKEHVSVRLDALSQQIKAMSHAMLEAYSEICALRSEVG